MEHHFFEPDLARVQAKLSATLSDASSISLLSWSVDRTRFIVKSMGPRDPGTYYLYDAKKDALNKISVRYPGLPSNELGEMLVIKYKARDGTRIPGYLTMPSGKGAKKLPMIVMPHGGPELRDYVTYDEWAQMLANAGYAVLQPNFRGSGGYGRAFTAAGNRQWGRLMQDDITDGVKALIADGTADPNRICIVGASYGGYAALAGGAFTPDLYKCVVSIAGIGDLPEFVTDRGREFTTDSWSYKIWVERIGDPRADSTSMKAASPSFNADKFKAPVLLIHGDKDEIVPIEQSRRMDKALRDAGKSVEFITIEDEGHHFAAEESDIRVMKEIDRFVAANIGAN
jgi:dipeptidyl aminopeptidase/acylaminoacyl peptidase